MEGKEILNLEEASELFGVSVKTFIKILKEEKLPARKIGREWRFSKKALLDWLSSGDSQIYSFSESDTKTFFNNLAGDWEILRNKYFDNTIIDLLLEMKVLNRKMTVLDIGAGDGYFSIPLSKKVKKVISVDLSDKMLKELEKKASVGGIKNIELIEANGLDMPIENKSVDFVCASFYLHHIEATKAALVEIYRVLRDGGYIFITDFYSHNNKKFLDEMHDYWYGFNVVDIEKKLKEIGFLSISTKELFKLKKEDIKVFMIIAKK